MEHYNLVQDMLHYATSEQERSRIQSYLKKMHESCTTKVNCTYPCHIQHTTRGDFCVYAPGSISTLPKDIQDKIFAEDALESAVFVRREVQYPSDVNASNILKKKARTNTFIPFTIYIPHTLVMYAKSMHHNIVNVLKSNEYVCNIVPGNPIVTGIGAILRERPYVRHIPIDVIKEIANEIYFKLHFDVMQTESIVQIIHDIVKSYGDIQQEYQEQHPRYCQSKLYYFKIKKSYEIRSS